MPYKDDIESITPVKLKIKFTWSISLDKIKKIINRIKSWKNAKEF